MRHSEDYVSPELTLSVQILYAIRHDKLGALQPESGRVGSQSVELFRKPINQRLIIIKQIVQDGAALFHQPLMVIVPAFSIEEEKRELRQLTRLVLGPVLFSIRLKRHDSPFRVKTQTIGAGKLLQFRPFQCAA